MTRAQGPFVAAAALVAGLWAGPLARAGDLKAVMDFTANEKLLETRFGKYGQHIVPDPGGVVRFSLPAQAGGAERAGLYSLFALAGDFEVLAEYTLIALPAPQGGYGAGLGVTVDTEGRDGSVTLARRYLPKKGSGYVVSRTLPGEGGKKQYKTEHWEERPGATQGRLVVRRKKAELTFLVADGPGEELRELCRVPFTAGTVRKLLVNADSGGSPTAVDVRVGGLVVRAEEVAGGIPQRESRGRGWWLVLPAAGVVVALSVYLYFVYRRKGLASPGGASGRRGP
jgi:hypothetical protein